MWTGTRRFATNASRMDLLSEQNDHWGHMERRGVPWASSETVRRRMRATGQRDTVAEMLVRQALHRMCLRYRLQVAPLPGLRRTADIVFRSRRVAVLIDGCFWHGCPLHGSQSKTNTSFWQEKIETNQRRDRDTDLRLRQAGWTVVRVWEHEDPARAAAKIARIIRNTQSMV